MPHTEPSANYALGTLLQGMMPGHTVKSEHTGLIVDHPGQHADNLITGPGIAPVAVEAEFMPAAEVEHDATARLGLRVMNEPHFIEAVVALRYPAALADAGNLNVALSDTPLSYALLYSDGSRFPESGWLEGSAGDLADLVRLASIPQQAVNRAADTLQQGIERAVAVLNQVAEQRPATSRAIAHLLGMEDLEQTRRMACAIIANAMVFHERIAGMHDGVKPLRLVCGAGVPNPQDEVLKAWEDILNINYWAIFAIARDIMAQLTSGPATGILAELRDTAQRIDATGVNNAHDLTGRIFQRLIADRKYLATFYTRPASAALLAHLAIAKMDGVDWSDPDAIAKLRIADFACGTGALLSAAYEQIASQHEREGGGSATALHRPMMEDILYGCDVMPSAVHITGSTLSGAQPNIGFNMSRLYTLPYGRQDDNSVKVGSLELLQASNALTLFNTSDPAFRTGSLGQETTAQINAEFPDTHFNFVIMNPPYSSNTKHYDAADGVLNAAFAAFGASIEDQAEMAIRMDRLSAGTAYHGHAGLGSAFASLADNKLAPNGVVALVLPFTAINGSSWRKVRKMIATKYTDVTVVSIAANGSDMCFSSDTGIAECLVIARKSSKGAPPTTCARFISVWSRPADIVIASEIVKAVLRDTTPRRLEDGPYGGSPIHCGGHSVGEVLEAPLGEHGDGWGAARLADATVAQVAHSLSGGKLQLPATMKSYPIPIAPLQKVGSRGLDSQMFISSAHGGPFTKETPSPTATYPALWGHDADIETKIICSPDSQMQVKNGMENRGKQLWANAASRVHFNRDFRFTSQPLSVAMTDAKSIGGRGWPNVIFDDQRFDYVLALWSNSTLGLLSYWWHSSRQQDGRGIITIHGAETLPILDLRSLSHIQLAAAEEIFEDFRDREFQPAYLADADPNRALLDRRLLCEVLEFDESVYEAVRRLAAKWCAEPSVHGGKPRPASAKFMM